MLSWLPLHQISFLSRSFSNSIAKKLDDSNYLHWQHGEPVIKSHKLQRFVVNPVVPPRYLIEDDRIVDRVNPEYEIWEVQDQMLLVWLQSTLSKSVLSRVLGSNHSYQVWDKIHEYFNLHTKSCARQLRTAMRAVTLDGKSIDEYLPKIKGYVDELAGVGVPVRHEEYVDASEIEALPYGHEIRLTR